jgi:hypothetical protein
MRESSGKSNFLSMQFSHPLPMGLETVAALQATATFQNALEIC